MTIPFPLTTTQASHPAARTRSRTFRRDSSRSQIGTSRRATVAAVGRPAAESSVGSPAAIQSDLPAA
jgi:hypothetical protein